ncbi:hypothetical protein, partial [Actinophytocola xanthii]|uniref:hypothetical protein n=1 Tax=Actinophytocola xanthii TaxID=1912961 RepID=UPI001E613951
RSRVSHRILSKPDPLRWQENLRAHRRRQLVRRRQEQPPPPQLLSQLFSWASDVNQAMRLGRHNVVTRL